MAKRDNDAVWCEIDPQSLNTDAFKAYNAYVAARKVANELKKEFEAAMREDNDAGKGSKLVFGYNFGKLSIAIVPDTDKPKATAKPKLSLADYLKQQQR